MSKVAVKGNASGTGTFTIETPNSDDNRTLTLPDEAGTVLTSASDLAAANLTGNVAAARITDALNASGSAPIYACRAWVNFDGTTLPGTIRASGNVSSVTRSGAGQYLVNFSTALPDTAYSTLCTQGQGSSGTAFSHINTTANGGTTPVAYTTTQVSVASSSNQYFDAGFFCVAVFR
jgi:hypothetical protein